MEKSRFSQLWDNILYNKKNLVLLGTNPSKWAKNNHFKFIRSDRGAQEYSATRKTPKKIFDGIAAFTLHNYIFYSSMKAARTASICKHELDHVRQSKRLGIILYDIWYCIETLLVGYEDNRFEVEARLAEKRRSYPNVGKYKLSRFLIGTD
jgi:hypothetical protein